MLHESVADILNPLHILGVDSSSARALAFRPAYHSIPSLRRAWSHDLAPVISPTDSTRSVLRTPAYHMGHYIDGRLPSSLTKMKQIPEPYALLGLIYLDGGNLNSALMFYKLACTRDPKNIFYHEQGVRIARDLGDQQSLLQLVQTLARLQPTDLRLAIDKATCLVELDKPKQVSTWSPLSCAMQRQHRRNVKQTTTNASKMKLSAPPDALCF